MKRKIVICFRDLFPRHGAGANYVEYLASALNEGGAEVYVIAQLNSEIMNEYEKKGDYYIYKGIHICPFQFHHDKLRHYIEFHYFTGKIIGSKIKKIDLKSNDLIICYTQERTIFREILRIKKEVGCKIADCVVEWYDSSWFKKNREYMQYCYDFETFLPQFDLLLPISTYIAEYFVRKGKKNLVLPIMADINEYEFVERAKVNNFIIPANGRMKDSLEVMLKSFVVLEDYSLGNWCLHLCGISKEDVLGILTNEEWDKIEKKVVIHPWMKYSELVKLYQKMNFLVLARETTHMSLSNFPSKIPEAMTHGVIPIVSKVGDYTEKYLCEKNAFIFEPCNVSKCFEQIRKALSLGEVEYKRMSFEARKCAETKFDYHNWIDLLNDAIEKI